MITVNFILIFAQRILQFTRILNVTLVMCQCNNITIRILLQKFKNKVDVLIKFKAVTKRLRRDIESRI